MNQAVVMCAFQVIEESIAAVTILSGIHERAKEATYNLEVRSAVLLGRNEWGRRAYLRFAARNCTNLYPT